MNKYYGFVGYAETVETAPDVWEETITERPAQGDILKISRRIVSANQVNDSITVSNKISIVADPYAYDNFHAMRYITWMGTKWKVTNVDVSYPRLILEIGGVYNGPTGPEHSSS
jgi:hypothetical protein